MGLPNMQMVIPVPNVNIESMTSSMQKSALAMQQQVQSQMQQQMQQNSANFVTSSSSQVLLYRIILIVLFSVIHPFLRILRVLTQAMVL